MTLTLRDVHESGERYLSPAAKAAVLEDWLKVRQKEVPLHAGGSGYPDRHIFALTDVLNQLEHVQTMQSCSGHTVPCTNLDPMECHGVVGPHTFTYDGQLWLWLRHQEAVEAYHRLHELERLPLMRFVRVNMVGGQEMLDLTFAGNERTSVCMPELVRWLAELAS